MSRALDPPLRGTRGPRSIPEGISTRKGLPPHARSIPEGISTLPLGGIAQSQKGFRLTRGFRPMLAQSQTKRAPVGALLVWLPGRRGDRTIIWDVFDYVFEGDRRRMRRIRVIRTYRNPIFLAREWAEAMKAGNFRSQQTFARAIGLSHARVSQVLGLLRLYPDTLDALDALGDPLYSRKVTERKLRPILNLPKEKQCTKLLKMLSSLF